MIGSFLLLGAWEGTQPRRALTHATGRRWGIHGLLLLCASLLNTLLMRTSPLLVAAASDSHGLLRPLPWLLQFAIAILLLDLVHYLSHRLFHWIGPLWRIHEVHHSDPDYDVSTAARFHPFEVGLGTALYLGAVALLGPPVSAVFFAELLTQLLNVFVHANVVVPAPVERLLRYAFITPDLHRIHHSIVLEDQNRNFGQTFLWWDRLFGTYLPRSASGEMAPATGTGTTMRDSLPALLVQPFRLRK